MKNTLFYIAAALLLFGCTEAKDTQDPGENEGKMVEVSLSLTGDILPELETSTRSGDGTIYGVNIYRWNGESFERYSYAQFSDLENIKVSLLSDFKYKCEIGIFSELSSKTTIEYPFWLVDWSGSNKLGAFTEMNTFVVNQRNRLFLNYGCIPSVYVKSFESLLVPDLKKFHGESREFYPEDGGIIEIEAHRGYRYMRFEASNLAEGRIIITAFYVKHPDFEFPAPIIITPQSPTLEILLPFYQFSGSDPSKETYSESLYLSAEYIKSDGSVIPIGDQEKGINFVTYRNKMNILRLALPEKHEVGMDISIDTTIENLEEEVVTIVVDEE